MNVDVDGSVEVTSSQRRSSTVGGTGLDYSSCHRVDEDITCRIRSLLLSRNDHCPPKTPFPSDERNHRYPEIEDTTGGFDFSTAKSVAKLAHAESRRLSTPDTRRLVSKGAEMESRKASRPSLPSLKFALPRLRSSSSANDLKVPADDTIQSPTTPNFDPDLPGETTETKTRFRLPKLVLQDKKKRSRKVRSCIEINPPIPADDARIHETELLCCPPCDPDETPYTINYPKWPGGAVRAIPGDLACFLAGCPASHLECKRHHRRRESVPARDSIMDRQIGEDFVGVAGGIKHDIARLGHSLKDIKFWSPYVVSAAKDRPDAQQASQSNVESQEAASSHKHVAFSGEKRDFGSDGGKAMPSTALKSPSEYSEICSSVTSTSDAFPHAFQSLELAAKESLPQRLSTTVSTNFSLPGYKTNRGSTKEYFTSRQPKQDDPNNPALQTDTSSSARASARFSPPAVSPADAVTKVTVRPKQSYASLTSKSKPPSLLSGGSRSSARHALLKPSVTGAQPVDTGLPVPPVLSSIAAISEQAVPEILASRETLTVAVGTESGSKVKEEVKAAANADNSNSRSQDLEKGPTVESGSTKPRGVTVGQAQVAMVSPVVGHITSVQNAEDLLKNVQSRVEEAQAKTWQLVGGLSSRPQSPPPSLVKAKAAMGAPQLMAESPHQHSSPTEAKNPASATQALPTSLVAGSNVCACPEPLSAGSQPPADSLNAAYWGFVPAVKEAVQDAVQIAVRNAVHEIVVLPGVEKDEASDAYRKLVANSLAEAAKNADNYLRRASLWNEPPSSTRASESTVIHLSRSLNGEQTEISAVGGDPCDEMMRRVSIVSKENDAGKAVDPTKNMPRPGRYSQIGNALINPESCDKVALSGDELEVRPFEQDGKPLPKSNKKRSKAWRNGSPFGYEAIPTRKSSKNRVLSPKTPSMNTPSNPEKTSRKRSFERLISRVKPVLRSISSEGSLKQDKDGEKSLLSGNDIDRHNGRSSASQVPSEELIGHKNTVHWLKELLSSTGPYEPRFTALPPRTRRGYTVSGVPLRSQTAPAKPVAEVFLGATPNPAEEGRSFVKDKLSAIKRDERAGPSETLTRTINDLENLMNEALIIARQAADNEDAGYVPAVLGDAAKVLKSGRDRYQARLSGTRYSDGDSNVPSIHESLKSLSDSDASYYSDDADMGEEQPEVANGELSRAVTTSITSLARNPSGWPPTGRGTTPYPPASMLPSSNSRSPPDSRPSPAEGIEKARAADPRCLPTETELNAPRKSTTFHPVESNAALDDSEFWDEPAPEFRTLEPFSEPGSRQATRKSSSKSPKRLSPTRQTQSGPAPVPTVAQDLVPLPKLTPRNTDLSRRCAPDAHSEEEHQAVKSKLASKSVPSKQEVRDYIEANRNPPIQPRTSSRNLRKEAKTAQGRNLISSQTPKTGHTGQTGQTYAWQNIDLENMEPVSENRVTPLPDVGQQQQSVVVNQPGYAHSFDGSQVTQSEEVDFNTGYGVRHRGGGETSRSGAQQGIELQDNPDPNLPQTSRSTPKKRHAFSLRGKNHVSLKEHHHKGFSLARSHKRQSIARDWSPGRKRFVASVACFSTALIGILVGIYAGETPAIQYYIVDFHHYTVLGNVFFFIGLAIPTFFFWPLPLLHGRKPYILGSMSLAMPLLFPQALAVGQFRSPYVATWRVGLILPRAVMGFCLGFANMNFKAMLTDLFGASLQSTNPHQEHVDKFDVRRHGGGMGVWLGLWTWSALGSIGLGFLIGAVIVNHLPPAWGFYVSITIIAFIMLLNVLCPEVRRSAFRRSVAEVVNGQEVSRRLARGEVKMHMVQSGPKWWGEEFHYGVMLSMNMLRQPGFMVMALYVAWIYGQMVLNILVNITSF
jgi:MFS family permease